MSISKSVCHSFSLQLRLYFSLLNCTGRFIHRNIVTEFCYFFFYFTFTYVPLDELIPFYRKQFSPDLIKRKVTVLRIVFFKVFLP